MNKNSKKILIITGDNTCYNALNEFALSFEEGLRIRGYEPVLLYVNVLNQDIMDMLVKTEYRAVLGFQTNLFSLEISPGIYVGNLISAPKFNYIFDPPATKRKYFEPYIEGLTFFYHDMKYIEYLNKYFPHVSVMYNPPAGGVTGLFHNEGLINYERRYDFSFVGSYTNYRSILDSAASRLPDWADMIMCFFEYLIKKPNIDVVHALEDFVIVNDLDISQSEISILLELLFPAENAAKSYYREKVIRTLLEGGVSVDVFSESWKTAPFEDYEKLHIHSDIYYRENMKVLTESKMSLNVFPWHKDSFTERIANIMLNGAVCVSDKSSRLQELFDEDNEIILYDFENLSELPNKVKELLNNNELRMKIACAGYNNAYMNHRWINRVDEFISVINDQDR